MITQSQVFIRQCIDISWFFFACAGPGMLQHAFYDSIGTPAMMIYFFLVEINIRHQFSDV